MSNNIFEVGHWVSRPEAVKSKSAMFSEGKCPECRQPLIPIYGKAAGMFCAGCQNTLYQHKGLPGLVVETPAARRSFDIS